jgi:hypothetical protein
MEKFLIVLYGFGCVALLFIDLAEHVEALGVDITIIKSPGCEPTYFFILFYRLFYFSRFIKS